LLEIDKKIFLFREKEVYFSKIPFDMNNCDNLEFQYCKKKVDIEGFERKNDFTSVIDLTKDINDLWMQMDRNNRNRIKRAEAINIKIQINKDFEKFYQMYLRLYKKKKIKPFLGIFGFGIIPLKLMKKYGILFTAELNGEILCGNLYLEDKNNVFAWAGASNRFDVDKEKAKLISWANRFVIWESIKYYKNKQKIEFDQGGMWAVEEAEKDKMKRGINKFKSSFGGKLVKRYSYKKIYSNSYTYLSFLYNLRLLNSNKINNNLGLQNNQRILKRILPNKNKGI